MVLEGRSDIRPMNRSMERNMSWTVPVVVEVCIGMAVTSYAAAEF